MTRHDEHRHQVFPNFKTLTERKKRGRQRQGRPDPAVDEQWRKIYEEVRDRWWCEGATPACESGRHRGAHAHHVILRSQGGPDEAWNLKWLCHPAHTWVHANPAEAAELGLIRRRGQR